MNIRGNANGAGKFRHWLSQVVLFAFVCRALIPVGFMPDFAGASKGVYQVVICTGYGPQSIDLDANGQKVPTKHGTSHHQPCAFSTSPTVASLNFPEVDVAPLGIVAEVSATGTFEALPPVRAGPAVGSRAPPQFS
jgi:hypothetical protein